MFKNHTVDDGKTQGHSYLLFFGKNKLINSRFDSSSTHAGTADNEHAISLDDAITISQITTLLHHARFLI